MEAIKGLNPVTYAYKGGRGEQRVGFIAEEVPKLVSLKDRKGLSPMDIVAVLTKVVQEQQEVIQEQQEVNAEYRKAFEEQQEAIAAMSEELKELKREVRTKGAPAIAGYSVDR